jgi:hypothetical protein
MQQFIYIPTLKVEGFYPFRSLILLLQDVTIWYVIHIVQRAVKTDVVQNFRQISTAFPPPTENIATFHE